MNKNKKYILIALLASLLFTVTIGFSVWIILSEQVRGHVQKMGEISFAPTLNSPTATYYAGEAAPFSYDPVIYSYYYNGESTPKQWEITGTAEINTLVGKGGSLTDGALDTECVITFRPTSPLAQWLWGETITATVTVKLLPVAQNGDVYYTTVDKALEGIQNASSGTVYVIPSGDYTNIEDPETGRARFAKTITPVYNEKGEEVPRVIPKGVTLMLPQATTVDADTGAISYSGTERNKSANGGFATSYSNKATYCTNLVSIASSLTCNGTIEVCGVINAAGEKQIAGQVYGKFGLLHLADGGKLSVSGTAKIFGFLEATDAYEDVQFNNGSILQQSFLFYEYRSGGDTVAMVSTYNILNKSDPSEMYCCPFYRYLFPNIIGSYTINYGAKFQAITALNISDNLIAETINVMGNTSAYFVQMTSGASVKVRYDHDDKVGLNTYGTDTYGHSSWSLTGGATINAIQVPVSISILTVTLTTQAIYLPIPYLLEIEFLNGSYSFPNQDVKVLPGGKVIIGEGATVTCKNLMLAKDPPPVVGDTKSAKIPYPTADQLTAKGLPTEGACVIRSGGEVILTAASGKFTAEGAGGILKVTGTTTAVSLELYGPSGTTGTVSRTGVVTGFTDTLYYVEIKASDFPFAIEKLSDGVYTAGGTYYSADRGDGTYGWYQPTFDVTLNANGGVLNGITNPYPVSLSTPGQGWNTSWFDTNAQPERAYYTFSHWCKSSTCKNDNSCGTRPTSLYDDATLYAIWTADPYYIIYDCDDVSNITESTTIANAVLTNPNAGKTSFTNDTKFTLDAPTYGVSGGSYYVFDGWYSDASYTTPITTVEPGAIAEGDTLTVYGRWYPAGTKFYTINYYTEYKDNEKGFEELLGMQAFTSNLSAYTSFPSWGADINTDLTYPKHFIGWSSTNPAEKTTLITNLGDSSIEWNYDDPNNPKCNLYAVWGDKYQLLLSASSSGASANQSVAAKEFWLTEGQISTVLTAELGSVAFSASKDNNAISVEKYFAGWAITGTTDASQAITTLTTEHFSNRVCTLHAIWAAKAKITINSQKGRDYNYYVGINKGATPNFTISFSDGTTQYTSATQTAADSYEYFVIPGHQITVKNNTSNAWSTCTPIKAGTATSVDADLAITIKGRNASLIWGDN